MDAFGRRVHFQVRPARFSFAGANVRLQALNMKLGILMPILLVSAALGVALAEKNIVETAARYVFAVAPDRGDWHFMSLHA